jgi:D-glycero-D-manno-heptose 1,7-bisphosphate phosphatase
VNRALFLDRDGVINVDHGYVSRPEDFELVPGIIDLLQTADAAGYLLVVVTNQSGIARGLFDQHQYTKLEAHMRDALVDKGVTLAGVYHCPHHVDGRIPEFAIACDCRKPAPGLILRAAEELSIDLGRSMLVGDKPSDVEAAERAGVGRSFLVAPDTIRASFEQIAAALRASVRTPVR